MHEPAIETYTTNIAYIDRKPPLFDEDTVKYHLSISQFWEFNWIGRLNQGERKHFDASLKFANEEFLAQRDIKMSHRLLLNKLISSKNFSHIRPLIIITRQPLPGQWFSISNFQSITIISANSWNKLFAPPRIEIYFIREILLHTLLYKSRLRKKYLYHDQTRGCLFDSCWDKYNIKSTLWGYICGECSSKLSSGGISRICQEQTVDLLRYAVGFDRKDALKTLTSPKVFISFSRHDRQTAKRIRETIIANGCNVWMDEYDLNPGQDWESVIMQEINDADFLILCLSKSAIEQEGYFYREFREALSRQKKRPFDNCFIIPVLLSECDIPREIHGIHHVNLHDDFSKGIEKILKSIKKAYPAPSGKINVL